MGLIKAKCLNCGANINVDSHSKTGMCSHCGTNYITEDITINRITNITYHETVDGVQFKRQEVLENLLIEYYMGKYDQIENIKEYALKVQEIDLNNVLAHFVVFDNIDSNIAIKKLLSNKNLKISLKLFILLLNTCGDDLNHQAIINNILKFQNQIDGNEIVKDFIDKCYKKDYKFYFNLIYNFKFNEIVNDNLLEYLYENKDVNKITFLSQLKLFKLKHNDFNYNEHKFNEYTNHWRSIKEKQILAKQLLNRNDNIKEDINNKSIKNKKQIKKLISLICVIVGIFLLVLILSGICA